MEEKKRENAFQKFTQKHAEIWKFIKFSIAGCSSSAVELVVHMVLLQFVFASLTNVVVNSPALNMIGVQSKGYLYAYLISTTVGYTIAFILNRKITFKADVNPALSMALYFVMVVFTIFANAWIGSAMTTFAKAHSLTGGFYDLMIKVIVMTIPTLWTYPCNRFIIHRHKRSAVEVKEPEIFEGQIEPSAEAD